MSIIGWERKDDDGWERKLVGKDNWLGKKR